MEITDSPARETWLGMLGLGIGITLIALAFAMPFLLPIRAGDGVALLAEHFEVSPPPFGLEMREALELPLGERIVLFAAPGATAEAVHAEAPAESAAKPPAESLLPAPPFDWSKLSDGPRDQAPTQIAIVWYPRAMAEPMMKQQFWSIGAGGDMVGPEGGKLVLDGGEIPWGEFGAAYVRERRFVVERNDGQERRFFRETMRVNLSRHDQPCVLYATWDEGMPASRARLEEALACFKPRS